MAEKNSRRNETTDALFDAILSLESREASTICPAWAGAALR